MVDMRAATQPNPITILNICVFTAQMKWSSSLIPVCSLFLAHLFLRIKIPLLRKSFFLPLLCFKSIGLQVIQYVWILVTEPFN